MKNTHFAQELRPRSPSVLFLTQNFNLGASKIVTKTIGGYVFHAIPAKSSRQGTPIRTPVFRDSNTLILGLGEEKRNLSIRSMAGNCPQNYGPQASKKRSRWPCCSSLIAWAPSPPHRYLSRSQKPTFFHPRNGLSRSLSRSLSMPGSPGCEYFSQPIVLTSLPRLTICFSLANSTEKR